METIVNQIEKIVSQSNMGNAKGYLGVKIIPDRFVSTSKPTATRE